ncbi:hypothetical protein [Halorubrum lacusprofundi]|uniref:Uncharacterized protein n=1 Tax=Halorubrum lacusprofundi TaxID=2247 RepID=A0A220SXV6_9EURY|nr:hypothetical protein [Halorubrum lacusprofundi]ASK38260.1 hypothetical protein [Halorubrum lacusprofundi]
MSSPRDTLDDVRFSELVNEGSDIPAVADRLKSIAAAEREMGRDTTVDELLAQSRRNDAAYLMPSDIEKAEWVADLYEREDRPDEHARDFHYRLVSGEYKRRNGEPYVNSDTCWKELNEALKWARILRYIKPGEMENTRNHTVTPTAFDDVDRPLPESGPSLDDASASVDVDDGFRRPKIPQEVTLARELFDGADEFIATAAKMIADQTFRRVYFSESAEQRYYIEIWCEKSGVVPEDLAGEYGATIRESGQGEFSLGMVEEAVTIASKRDQDLAVVVVSDFDSAGSDMGLSAARKSEVLGALHGVEVEVVRGAITKAQVEEYGIPGNPSASKVPKGLEEGVRGAKGYETQKELFREYAGQFPVELQGFTSVAPDAFEDELEESLATFYDADLGDRIKSEVREARERAQDRLVDAFEEHRAEIQDALDELHQGLDRYDDEMGPHVDAAIDGLEQLAAEEKRVRDECGIRERRDRVEGVVDRVDHRAVVAEVDVPVPAPDTPGVDDPILDTRRSFLEQLNAYKRHNMRSGSDDTSDGTDDSEE